MQWEGVASSRSKKAWVKDIIRKLTFPGFLAMSGCGVTFSIAKACILLQQHKWFVASDLEVECVTSFLPQLDHIIAL